MSGPEVCSPAMPWLRGKLLGKAAGLSDRVERENAVRCGSYLARHPQRRKAKQTTTDICL